MAVTLDRHICEKYFTFGKRIAVALSGGADSVCLCSLLSKLAAVNGFTLYALHLNHMIRGDEADRDERFCKRLCDELSVRLISHREDVPALAKACGKSLEEAARDARYSFFETVMKKEGISVIATAHNADDNAETVLFRLIRGASLDGICGIRTERELAPGLTIVRPILAFPKRDIIGYCEENGLGYVTDSTNACIDYPRNRIRARILPEAEAIDPAFLSVMARNCEQFSLDSDFLRSEADILYDEAYNAKDMAVLPLIGKHRAIVSRAVLRFCMECGAEPDRKHVEAICDAIERGGSYSISVPNSQRVVIDGGRLYVCPDLRRKKSREVDGRGYRFDLWHGDNEHKYGPLTLKVWLDFFGDDEKTEDFEEYSNDSELIYTLSICKTLNFDTIKGSLFVRSRISGDCIDFGMFHKDIRRAMSEKKIPAPLRGVMPILCDDDGIVYVPCVGTRKNASEGADMSLKIKISLTLDLSGDAPRC